MRKLQLRFDYLPTIFSVVSEPGVEAGQKHQEKLRSEPVRLGQQIQVRKVQAADQSQALPEDLFHAPSADLPHETVLGEWQEDVQVH